MEDNFTCGQKVKDNRYGNGVVKAISSNELKAHFEHPTILGLDYRKHRTDPMDVIYQRNNHNSIEHLSVILP